MKRIKLFEEFHPDHVTPDEELELLQHLVDRYTVNKRLDLEEETALFAICNTLGLDPKSIKQLRLFLKNKSHYELQEGSAVSDRTEGFIQKVLCHYLSKDNSNVDENKIKDFLSKLNMNFDEIKKTCTIQ